VYTEVDLGWGLAAALDQEVAAEADHLVVEADLDLKVFAQVLPQDRSTAGLGFAGQRPSRVFQHQGEEDRPALHHQPFDHAEADNIMARCRVHDLAQGLHHLFDVHVVSCSGLPVQDQKEQATPNPTVEPETKGRLFR
jgi:hypothetical protein